MNGRVYDPTLGRMLQADPFIQSPGNTQSYNRYSYVQNNPLRYTDPSGYNWKDWVAPVVAVAATVACYGYFECGIHAYMAIGATSGGASAAANGGDIVQGAIVGGISGAAFYGVGEAVGPVVSAKEVILGVAGYGAIGGVASVVSGGEFHHGFISAGAGALIPGGLGGNSYEMMALRTIGRGIIGGTVSELTGGKFANGAATAAFASIVTETAYVYSDAGQGGSGEDWWTSYEIPDSYLTNELLASRISGPPHTSGGNPFLGGSSGGGAGFAGGGGMAARAVVPSSRSLGRALEVGGNVRPTGSAAHHIVAGGAARAAPARAVLDRFGIGINDAANGAFLRVNVHNRLHTNTYYDAVNSALSQATSRQEALQALNALRRGLQ